MLAYTYRKQGEFALQNKPEPVLTHAGDAVVRVTMSSICTSDLHIKHGSVPRAVPGITVGHEMVGVVEQVGSAVKTVKPGDRVAVNVETFCGHCFFCQHGFVNNCTDPNGGWALGCRIDGGQAEYVRVPYADQGLTVIPDRVSDRQALFDELCAGKYLAEEFVQSDDSLARFHPASLNTLRVITFRRGDRFEVFGAGLRVGNNGLHVDNAHGGGIFCEIDPATGVIMTDGLDEHGNSYLCHPMTGVPFRGEVIPQWEEVRAFCRSAAQTLPCLRVVGWDVAILPGGKLELIEGNHNPGMNIVQAPAKHGVHDKFAHMLLDFYGDPAQYACETVKQP